MSGTAELLFARARTALKVGLRQFGFKQGDKILVPDFICEALVHPLLEFGLVPTYYSINQDLSPDWQVLESTASNSSHAAIIMVHYFGQPQDIERFREFSDQYHLVLIDDNGHGHGGELGGRPLGTFGDIGIGSPRKFVGVPSGGCLYGMTEESSKFAHSMLRYPAYGLKSVARTFVYSFQPLWRLVKSWAYRNKEWGNPYCFRDSVELDYRIDLLSRWCIEKVDWKIIARQRRDRWHAWERFLEGKGLSLVFTDVHPESCPLALPAYASELSERNRWLIWGVEKKIPLYPWPSLPESVIAEKASALRRWGKLICFPLDVSPP